MPVNVGSEKPTARLDVLVKGMPSSTIAIGAKANFGSRPVGGAHPRKLSGPRRCHQEQSQQKDIRARWQWVMARIAVFSRVAWSGAGCRPQYIDVWTPVQPR